MTEPITPKWCGCTIREFTKIDEKIALSNSEPEVWYVVLFARKRDNTPHTKPERTSIQTTSNINDVLRFGRTMPKMTSYAIRQRHHISDNRVNKTTQPLGIWNIVALVGPMKTAADATKAYTLWTKNAHNGTVNKVARGEAIAWCMDVPSYVNWGSVFNFETQNTTTTTATTTTTTYT